MFYSAMNPCVISHNFRLVAFDTKKERNEFQRSNPEYKTISPKDAARLPQHKYATRYPHTICDETGDYMGFVFFTNDGKFHSIA